MRPPSFSSLERIRRINSRSRGDGRLRVLLVPTEKVEEVVRPRLRADLILFETDDLDGQVEALRRLLHVARFLARGVIERLRAVGIVPVVVHELIAAALPRPVRAALRVLRLAVHGREPVARLFHSDVPLRDVLLDEREEEAENRGVVAEQRRVRDAPGVHRAERDPRLLVPAPVHLLDRQDVAQLRVLVRLGADETIAVDHRALVAVAVEAVREPGHVPDGSPRRHLPGERVRVRRDGPDDA
mmetsp:Transcript_5537/g.20035  ORF Transcript_5537/g.20035 Transcript_5537/m.20035 type:complete len:243 (-) Transcript_5537:635-1363(-)